MLFHVHSSKICFQHFSLIYFLVYCLNISPLFLNVAIFLQLYAVAVGSVAMDRFTVELSIVGGHEFNKIYKETDHEYHIWQQLNSTRTCTFDEIVNNSTHHTIICGVAGIGKSHFASEIAYQWSEEV